MFVFKGKKSTDMRIYCKDEDFIGRASKIYEETTIEGHDGSLFNELGYQCYEKSITMYLRDTTKLDNILEWLDGKGEFIYNNRVCSAYFFDSVTTENMLDKAVEIKTKFIRDPFWLKLNDRYIQADTKVINEGNIYSKPVIKLIGTGKIDLTVNDVRFIYNFDNDGVVEIDCLEMTETYNGLSKSKNIEIGFNYPVLKKGENLIKIHSGSAKIYFKRKDTWL